MSIKFHCDHCGKKIDAPDGTGGRWGKCPACHNKVYVPQEDDEGELTLTPIDETEEERQKRLMAETFQLTQNILQEKDVPETGAVTGSSPDISEKRLTEIIVRYLRQMADGAATGPQSVNCATPRPANSSTEPYCCIWNGGALTPVKRQSNSTATAHPSSCNN